MLAALTPSRGRFALREPAQRQRSRAWQPFSRPGWVGCASNAHARLAPLPLPACRWRLEQSYLSGASLQQLVGAGACGRLTLHHPGTPPMPCSPAQPTHTRKHFARRPPLPCCPRWRWVR